MSPGLCSAINPDDDRKVREGFHFGPLLCGQKKEFAADCSAWRPREGALAEEMDVQVGDTFAAVTAVVDDEAVAGVGDAEFLCEGCSGEQEMAEGGLIGGGGFADARDEFFWNDEYVHRCLRGDVVDGDAEIIFVRELRGDLAVNDFLKKSFHGVTGEMRPSSDPRIPDYLQEETEGTESLKVGAGED